MGCRVKISVTCMRYSCRSFEQTSSPRGKAEGERRKRAQDCDPASEGPAGRTNSYKTPRRGLGGRRHGCFRRKIDGLHGFRRKVWVFVENHPPPS